MPFHLVLYFSLAKVKSLDRVIKPSEEHIPSLRCFPKSNTRERELDLNIGYYFSLS